jgi:membrane-bound lytic murein transglycosylase D
VEERLSLTGPRPLRIDVRALGAYHPRSPRCRDPDPAAIPTSLRTRPALFVLIAAFLAACATPPGPPQKGPEPAREPVAVPEPPPPAPVVGLVEEPPGTPPTTAFPPSVAQLLVPLPAPAEDLWARIRKGFALPDLDGPLVEKWEQWYAARPDYVARMVDRSRRYLYHIVGEVEERGMPLEIALLPMVESAYNPNALSTSRASGIWQFIPSTGKLYGMNQNFWFDSRRDVIAATEGALNYLTKLHGDFSDWQLALAAYNWGEGNVAKAIAVNERKRLPTDYASLKMPDETRNYLPKLQAVKNIVSDPARFGLVLDDIPDAPYFAVVKTARKMDVKRAADLAEMPQDEFLFLNPHFNRPVIAGAGEFTILLPIDKAELFAAKLDLSDQPLVSWQAYRLKPGETLPQVAAKFGLSVESLRAVNGLGRKARVAAGHTLLVPSARPTSEAEEGLAQAVFTTVPQGRTFYYRVRNGDTLSRVAERYGVTTADLRRWNGLAKDSVKAGQSLRITSDLAPNAAKARRATGRSGQAAKSAPARGAGPGGPARTAPAARARGTGDG